MKAYQTVELSGGTVTLQAWGRAALTGNVRELMAFLAHVADVLAPMESEQPEPDLARVRKMTELSLAPGSMPLPSELDFDDHMQLAATLWELNASEDGWGKVVGTAVQLRMRLLSQTREQLASQMLRPLSRDPSSATTS